MNTPYPDQNGDEHTVSEMLKSGPVLLAIYKSSCPACKMMMPFLNRIQDRYAGKGLLVYGVAEDSANVTRSFIRRSGLEYPILIEGDQYPLSNAFDVFGTPAIFVIDQNGEITYSTQGFMRDQLDEIDAAAAKLVGADPSPVLTAEEAEEIPRFIPGCPGKHLG